MAPRLALPLLLSTLTLAACGEESGDGESSSRPTSSAEPEQILITTNVKLDIPDGAVQVGDPTGGGEILEGSSVGDSPFCPDGTFRDSHGEASTGLVDRMIECPEGTLRIGFTPGPPDDDGSQSGPWRILDGAGAFEQWEGSGEMSTVYKPKTHGTEGSEKFTGTVTAP